METEGILDYQGRAGIMSIVRWNPRPVIFGVEKGLKNAKNDPERVRKVFSPSLAAWKDFTGISLIFSAATKGLEFGKKVTKKVTEASEKVTKKLPKESRKQKKVIELLLPTSFCSTLICDHVQDLRTMRTKF